MMAKSRVLGVSELVKDLERISKTLANREAKKGIAKAGTVVKKAAKDNVKALGLVDSGALLRGVAMASKKKLAKGQIGYSVGIKHGNKYRKSQIDRQKRGKTFKESFRVDDPFYYRFIELGTRNMQARPFLRTALLNNRAKAEEAMKTYLVGAVTKANKGIK